MLYSVWAASTGQMDASESTWRQEKAVHKRSSPLGFIRGNGRINSTANCFPLIRSSCTNRGHNGTQFCLWYICTYGLDLWPVEHLRHRPQFLGWWHLPVLACHTWCLNGPRWLWKKSASRYSGWIYLGYRSCENGDSHLEWQKGVRRRKHTEKGVVVFWKTWLKSCKALCTLMGL